MWIRLKKSYDHIRRRNVGSVMQVTNELGKKLINDKKAVEYTEGLPVKKAKTDFFKPKN